MADPDQRCDQPLVWSRAVVVGLLAGTLGVVGHVSAGGLLPALPVTLVLLVLCVPLSAPALQHRASPGRLAALLVGGQVVVHTALTATAGHRGDPASTPAAGGPTPTPTPTPTELTLPSVDGRRVGSLMDAYDATSPTARGGADLGLLGLGGLGDVAGHLAHHVTDQAPMMAAHTGVAVLLGLWLALGESALFTLVALAHDRLAALLAAVVPVLLPSRPAPASTPAPRRPAPLLAVTSRSRRGPPLLAAAVLVRA